MWGVQIFNSGGATTSAVQMVKFLNDNKIKDFKIIEQTKGWIVIIYFIKL